jgi:hypothetical protein
MRNKKVGTAVVLLAVIGMGTVALRRKAAAQAQDNRTKADLVLDFARQTILEGRKIFRFDTFGDEAFWGGTIMLHQAIAGSQHGGVGPGVSPTTALAVGLKVDVDALPTSLQNNLAQGKVNLNDPAITIALLQLNAVVGVTGFFDANGQIQSMGVQCALCHSTVDDSFAPGIGQRLDGWANRDLNVGAIVALAPNLTVLTNLLGVDAKTVKNVLTSWGPGKFDAELLLDGKGFRPDGTTSAVLIPPAFGLTGVNLGTWTGFGSTTYWNAFVANLEMHGVGTFYDPRLNNPTQFPIAAKAGFNNVRNVPDVITSKLAALTSINSLSPRRNHPQRPINRIPLPSLGRRFSTARPSAPGAMFLRFSPNRDMTCIVLRNSASTTSRQTDRLP